ncbi:hypothetical protein Taro_050763, partial [Colocasia esculenta]|nr:hypothetical protein [Colocasia esculenta]
MSGNYLPPQGAHVNPPGDLTLTEVVLQLKEEIRRMNQRMREGFTGIEERITESDRTVQGMVGCIVALEGVIREPRRDQAVERSQPQRPLSPAASRHPQPRAALADDRRGRYNDYDQGNFEEEIDENPRVSVARRYGSGVESPGWKPNPMLLLPPPRLTILVFYLLLPPRLLSRITRRDKQDLTLPAVREAFGPKGNEGRIYCLSYSAASSGSLSQGLALLHSPQHSSFPQGASLFLEPYYPCRFACNFGYDQAIPPNADFALTARLYKSQDRHLVASSWWCYFARHDPSPECFIPEQQRDLREGQMDIFYARWWFRYNLVFREYANRIKEAKSA